jgi:hypothetical protein
MRPCALSKTFGRLAAVSFVLLYDKMGDNRKRYYGPIAAEDRHLRHRFG